MPLDWANPKGPRIEVAFAWVPRTDLSTPASGTILAHGGGSGEAIPTTEGLRQVLGPVLEHQNLLVVDARGWGASISVRCEGLDLSKPATVMACAHQLRGIAPWLTSDQIAHDFDAVRSALGVQQLTLFGNSRGTVFAQAYAVRYPRHTRAVALDSAITFDDAGYAMGDFPHASYTAAQQDLRMLCDRSDACAAVPGDPVRRLADVVQRLRDVPDPEIGVDALFNLTSNLVFDATVGSELNAALVAYLDGDPAPLRRLIPLGRALDPQPAPENAAVLSLICGETAAPYDRAAGPVRRQHQLEAYYRDSGVLGPFGLEDLPAGGTLACVHWPTPRSSPVVLPGTRYPHVPVLVVGGNLDTVTPEYRGRAVAERFPNGMFAETDFGRHSDSLGLNPDPPSKCVNQILLAFLEDPASSSRGRCSGETYVAHGRFPLLARDLPLARGVPAGDARTVTAGFATAADAALRWHPASMLTTGIGKANGLRGGIVTYDSEQRTIRLDQARFVADVAVTGTVELESPTRAHAELTVGERKLSLTWSLSTKQSTHLVEVEVDGVSYQAEIPTF